MLNSFKTVGLKKFNFNISKKKQYKRYTRSKIGNFFYVLFLVGFGLFSVLPLIYLWWLHLNRLMNCLFSHQDFLCLDLQYPIIRHYLIYCLILGFRFQDTYLTAYLFRRLQHFYMFLWRHWLRLLCVSLILKVVNHFFWWYSLHFCSMHIHYLFRDI